MRSPVVGIVGAGGVGTFLAVRFARHHQVRLVYRTVEQAEAAVRAGICIRDAQGGEEKANMELLTVQAGPGSERCDVVFVCTKRRLPRRADLGAMLGDATRVIPVMNGIEHLAALEEDYAENAWVGTIRIFADLIGPGQVRQQGVIPEITYGALDGDANGQAQVHEFLQALAVDSGIVFHAATDVRDEVWRKFAFITAASAVGAACRVSLQQILACEESARFLRSVVGEACTVASMASGCSIGSSDMQAYLERVVASSDEAVTVSMQRDVLAGRGSELDAQLGAMLRLAAAHGVSAPALETAYAILLPQERQAGGDNGDVTPSPSEAEARRELAICHRLLANHGMTDLFVTHVSLRIPGEEAFLVSPFGTLFSQVTPKSLIKVSLDGRVLDAPDSECANETAFCIHAPLQRAGHVAVVHTHTAAGNAVACTPGGLRPWTQKAMLVRPFVRYHEYGALALGDEGSDEGTAMARALEDKEARVLVLQNHGLLSVGGTIGEAFLWMEWMEAACKYQVALSGQPDVLEPPEEAMQRTAQQARDLLLPGKPMAFDRPVYWKALAATVTLS